jgi:SAM-dependent methyltransferase
VDYRETLSNFLGLSLPETLTDVFIGSAAFGYRRPGMSAEFSNLRGRFPNLFPEEAADHQEGELAAIGRFLAPSFRAGETTTRSIRVRNGPRLLQTAGPNPHALSYHLYRDGDVVQFNGERSAFPVPLRPFEEMTVPVTIALPDELGEYELGLHLVEEHVNWGPELARYKLSVDDVQRPQYTLGLTGEFDYREDFNDAIKVLDEAIARHKSPRILELAGGLYPLSAHTSARPLEHYVVDLCFPELQLSRLHYADRSIKFVCGDVDALPLRRGSFDIVVICAALHHFPDPITTLERIKPMLTDNGNVVIVREPCFVDIRAEGYVRDLLAGFNEQVFLPEEYNAMFEIAGYKTLLGKVDFGGGLKVVLGKG